MTEILRAAVGVFATLAPFGLIPAYLSIARNGGEEADGGMDMTPFAAFGASLAALLAAIALTDPFLGFLDVSGENFQAGAAVIMAPLAVRLLWSGRSLGASEVSTSRPWLLPLAFPGLAGPAALGAVVAYSGRYSEAEAVAATVLAVAAASAILVAGGFLRHAIGEVAIGILGRLSGVLIVAIAVELAVDGIRSV